MTVIYSKKEAFDIGDMLSEMIGLGVFDRKDTEELSLQFNDKKFVFDNIMLLVSAEMDTFDIFFSYGDSVADKEDRS